MSLPPTVEHRVWWIWPRGGERDGRAYLRKQFFGKNFYFAVEKAKVHFGVERTQLDAELCNPSEIENLPSGTSEKVDPWRQLGSKKSLPKKSQTK